MNYDQYTNRPDWTSELRLHNGKVELIRHCGKCLSVIPGKTCKHCERHTQTVKEGKAHADSLQP